MFKKGDRVVFIDKKWLPEYFGKSGIIVGIDKTRKTANVKLDFNGQTYSWYFHRLQHELDERE
jgi:hypothetical protein